MTDHIEEKHSTASVRGKLVVAILIFSGLIAGFLCVFYWMNYVKTKPRADSEKKNVKRIQTNEVVRVDPQDKIETSELQEKQLEDLSTALNRLKGDLTGHFSLVRDIESFAMAYPQNSGGKKLLGMIRMYQNQFRLAYEQFAQSLKIDPDQLELQLVAGSCILRLGEVEKAEQHYQNVLKVDPTHARAIVHLASLRFKQQRIEEAESLLERALNQDAQMHEAHYRLGILLAELTPPEVDRAVRHIDRAIELAESSSRDIRPNYWMTKSQVLRTHGFAQEGLNFLVNVVGKEDIRRHPRLLHEMALCHASQKRYIEAAKVYERQMRLQPFEWRLAANAAKWRIEADDFDALAKHIAAIRRINPRAPVLSEFEKILQDTKEVNKD